MFYSRENLSKLFAEGAIRNLMNMLHCSTEDMNLFGELAALSVSSIMNSLNESYLPKTVLCLGLKFDLIDKCLWILCKKFKFATMAKLEGSHFHSLKQSLTALLEMKCPVLISVASKHACYHHVVVI
jgi:hypothetical protein